MADQVRWGILGCAGIARGSFIPAIKQTARGVLGAIASRDEAKAQEWAKEHGIGKAYGSYDELLADPEIDAVYVPTPNTLHAEWVIKAAGAGKAIFCEKPLAADAAEAQQMVDAADAAGVLFIEAFVFLYHAQSQLIRELLDAGRIGEVRAVHSQFHYKLTGESRTHNIRTSAELAGGALMDVGCYCINGIRFAFGAEPVTVSAQALIDPAFGVDTTAGALLGYDGGRYGTFSVSMDMPGGQGMRIYGTEGEMRISMPFHPRGEGAVVEIVGSSRDEVLRAPAERHPFADALDHVHACLLDGTRPLLTASDGVQVMRVLDACKASYTNGERVRL